MKLQQLRYLVEVAKQGLNVSEAAEKLHTSQPGISKQIRLLEDELGIQVFIRNGKRVVSVSDPGKEVLKISERILREAQNLKRVGDEFSREAEGSLTIATTHTQARYALPAPITAFIQRYPSVRLSIKQGSPTQICEMVVSGEADLAIATEGIALYKELAMLPCYEWNRGVVVQEGHPLLTLERPITLADIASYPIITYDFAFTGRSKINKAFAEQDLVPTVALTAIRTSSKPTSNWAWASALSPTWHSSRNGIWDCALLMPATCLILLPPRLVCARMLTCADLPIPLLNCLLRICTVSKWNQPCWPASTMTISKPVHLQQQ